MIDFIKLKSEEKRIIFENTAAKLRMNSSIIEKDLLIKVADFKNKFYYRKWAEYENARIGTLKLSPAEHSIKDLENDYIKMREMIYGEYPSFEELLDEIKKVELRINNYK